jgi:hypothetical protein
MQWTRVLATDCIKRKTNGNYYPTYDRFRNYLTNPMTRLTIQSTVVITGLNDVALRNCAFCLPTTQDVCVCVLYVCHSKRRFWP